MSKHKDLCHDTEVEVIRICVHQLNRLTQVGIARVMQYLANRLLGNYFNLQK